MLKLRDRLSKFRAKFSHVHFRDSRRFLGVELSRSALIIGSSGFIFFLTFSLAFLSLRSQNPNLPSSASINPSAYSVAISIRTTDGSVTASNGNLNFNIEALPDGTMLARKQTINVKTNAISGYKLYLSAGDTGSNLFKPAGFPSGTASGTIYSNSGSHANPATLDMNSWGYAIPSGANKAVNVGNFNSSYNLSLINSGNSNITGPTKWAPLMRRSAPTLIQQTNSANNANGENLDIYYALKVNMAIPAGTYTGKILYTAIIDATSNSSSSSYDGEATISPSRVNSDTGGNTATITTSLKLSSTDSSSSVANYLSSSDISITVSGSTCTSPSIQASQPTLTVACTLPASSYGSGKEVILSIPKLSKKYRTYIEYRDPNPYASGFNISSVSPAETTFNQSEVITITTNLNEHSNYPISSNHISATVGDTNCANLNLASKRPITITCLAPAKPIGKYDVKLAIAGSVNKTAIKASGLHYRETRNIGDITYMQDINPDICANSTLHQEKSLIDRRDNKAYRVLKAKDDNCWMTQPLDLILAKGVFLHNDDSDVDGLGWTPSASTIQNGRTRIDNWPHADDSTASYRATLPSGGKAVFYSWNAAVAGYGQFKDIPNNEEMPYSICPKGWQLPSNKNTNHNKSFAKFYKSYNPSAFNNIGIGGDIIETHESDDASNFLLGPPVNMPSTGVLFPNKVDSAWYTLKEHTDSWTNTHHYYDGNSRLRSGYFYIVKPSTQSTNKVAYGSTASYAGLPLFCVAR